MVGRGRPRVFEVDEAVEAAMNLFWERGYEGASLADLKKVMGLSSASFYNTFGSKEELFERVVRRYVDMPNKVTQIVGDTSLNPRDAIAQFLHGSVDAQTDPNRPRGCMLALNGSIGGTGLPEAAKESIVSRRTADRARVRGCLERAVAAGVLKPDTDVEAFTAALHGFVLGIAPQARDGLDAAQLHRSAEVLLMAWDAAALQK